MLNYIPLILFGVFLNAIAQVALKKGMMQIGEFVFSVENIVPISMAAATNLFVVLGLFCYVVSVLVWMMVLSRVEVSFAYPFLSVGYVLVAFIGYFMFSESITMDRIAGIALICLGVSLVSRSGVAA